MLENRNNFLISSRPKIVVVVVRSLWGACRRSLLCFKRKFHVESVTVEQGNLVSNQSYVRKTLLTSISSSKMAAVCIGHSGRGIKLVKCLGTKTVMTTSGAVDLLRDFVFTEMGGFDLFLRTFVACDKLTPFRQKWMNYIHPVARSHGFFTHANTAKKQFNFACLI